MPMPVITITKRKDGKIVSSFRDDLGRRVRTSTSVIGGGWVKAEQVKAVAQYGIELQLAQVDAGLGSDGTPMPPLKSRTWAKVQADGTIKTGNRPSYANFKIRVGLKPIRDLRGPGAGGHMLDAIRINYLDDKRAGFSITTEPSRTKAKANEKRAPWWGWSAASVAALGKFAGDIYQTGLVDYLVSVGLSSANVVAGAGRRILRRAA